MGSSSSLHSTCLAAGADMYGCIIILGQWSSLLTQLHDLPQVTPSGLCLPLLGHSLPPSGNPHHSSSVAQLQPPHHPSSCRTSWTPTSSRGLLTLAEWPCRASPAWAGKQTRHRRRLLLPWVQPPGLSRSAPAACGQPAAPAPGMCMWPGEQVAGGGHEPGAGMEWHTAVLLSPATCRAGS